MKIRYDAVVICYVLLTASLCPAVTSMIIRHQSSADFLKGETKNVVIGSTGLMNLAPHTEPVDTGDSLKGVWSILAMTAYADGAVYLGTGPDAKVFRYASDQLEQVYPIPAGDAAAAADNAAPASASAIRNEHVFALAKDLAGRLLIGVSGQKGKLIRLGTNAEIVFEDEKVQYIFAVVLDQANNIYLATGPNGRVYRLNPFCQDAEMIYQAKDRNILSLAVKDGVVYAGSDERGLIYKIDPAQKQATVLFDTEQNEIPSLLMDDKGNLCAAATSAAAGLLQLKGAGLVIKDTSGRPDSEEKSPEKPSSTAASSLNTANTDDESKKKEEAKPVPQAPPPPAPKAAGHIYKISPQGFVRDFFAELAVFYSLVQWDGKLWLGTGSKAQLYAVNPDTEEKGLYYEDKTSSQITSLLAVGDTLYLGLSNPARLVRMKKGYASEGVYESDLMDAGQPARWGKLQLEADIPDGCEIWMAGRSGNVKEPNDPTFSGWTPDVLVTQATDLSCPLGRFCQYRLTLKSSNPAMTPMIRQAAAACTIPNLAPTVSAVRLQRSRDKNKPSVYEIGFAASDDNNDTLEFTLEFRKQGRGVWIPLKDELDAPRYEWDSRTVEDGRYEVRVTANDRKSNTADTTLTGSRISDPVVIDNTPPEITQSRVKLDGDSVTMSLTVEDAYTMVSKVHYTVDSNDKWMGTLPEDKVYDTLTETFTIVIGDLKPGEHVIAVSAADDLGNMMYKTYEVTINP